MTITIEQTIDLVYKSYAWPYILVSLTKMAQLYGKNNPRGVGFPTLKRGD